MATTDDDSSKRGRCSLGHVSDVSLPARVAQGRRAGVLSVLGITSGCLVHTLAAAFGLSAILATSARAFLVVKFAGAAYLTYLGVCMLLERPEAGRALVDARSESAWKIYRAGVLT